MEFSFWGICIGVWGVQIRKKWVHWKNEELRWKESMRPHGWENGDWQKIGVGKARCDPQSTESFTLQLLSTINEKFPCIVDCIGYSHADVVREQFAKGMGT